jgi:hypothetical protein
MNLIEMEPRGDLSSTGYALANPGKEYLILQPSETGDPFRVMLKAGAYTAEWFEINTRAAKEVGAQTVGNDGGIDFTPPFSGKDPVVLYLKAAR